MRKLILSRATPAALLLAAACLGQGAQAQTACIYDPRGSQGPTFAEAVDYGKAARKWGADLSIKAYPDETVAVEDFKAGQCDMLVVTGLRVSPFNKFTGTLDAFGAVQDDAQMSAALKLIAAPTLAKHLVNGDYEVAGIYPLGAAYPFVHDRRVNTLAKIAGKKIAVMDWDKTQSILVSEIGAVPEPSDITSYGPKFNNGTVDVVVAPLILLKPFELSRGIGSKGAIVRFPILQLTAQLVIHRSKFPAGFGQSSRDYVASHIERPFREIHDLEQGVAPALWEDVPAADRDSYMTTMREARVNLRKQGYYDPQMLALLKHVRCDANPAAGECATPAE
jgi:hypothetical protein